MHDDVVGGRRARRVADARTARGRDIAGTRLGFVRRSRYQHGVDSLRLYRRDVQPVQCRNPSDDGGSAAVLGPCIQSPVLRLRLCVARAVFNSLRQEDREEPREVPLL